MIRRAPDSKERSIAELRARIVERVAEQVGADPRAIDPGERFQRLGLDSLTAGALLAALSAELGRPLAATLVWQYPTPEALARYLVEGDAAPARASAAPRARPADDEPIAIIGMACRFPQAPDVESFWALLRDGVDAITEVPADRWDADAVYDPDISAPGKMNTRWGGFLDHVDGFDPQFFGISPREASHMDPQQRVSLEVAWEALEDAGIPPVALRGSATGVFFGTMWAEYTRVSGGSLETIAQHTATGQDTSIASARISYILGLQGPSLTVNTACSSSLVALHLACQSLRSGESELALVGGVNLIFTPESTIAMSKFGGLSPDGRCFTFDERANGYVRSEGCAAIVLKPLSRALADGDRVDCVILASAINNDGASNGLTAPNPIAQEAVLRLAYERAGVDPAEVQYAEAHGTGTNLGDPIEARALSAVLCAGRSADMPPLVVGSVKTNIGHTEGAAGLAGVIKVALSMRHRQIPPSLHFQNPNPHIPFADLRLDVPTDLRPWPGGGARALAGVSSFGFGGTNAHVVLESRREERAELFVLSAASPQDLRHMVEECLAGEPGAADRVDEGPLRLAVTNRSSEDLAGKLEGYLRGEIGAGVAVNHAEPGRRPKVVFAFSGQGSQWAEMGSSLLAEEPVFRAVIERCDRLIQQDLGWSLLAELTRRAGHDRLDQMDVAWPSIVALEIALAALWRSWGVEPSAVVGHSIGEVAAAHVAGILSLEDAMRIICAEGRLISRPEGRGAMGVIGLSWEDAGRAIAGREDRLHRAIAADPGSTVLTGDPESLDEVLAALEGQGVFARRVHGNVAAHSPQLAALAGEMREAIAGIAPSRGQVPMMATGDASAGMDVAYWVRNFTDPVMFSGAVEALASEGHDLFLEVGPHPVVKHSIEATLRRRGAQAIALPSLRRGEDARTVMLDTLGALYTLGQPVDWAALAGEAPPADPPALLFPLSAKSVGALDAAAARLHHHLIARPDLSLGDVAFSLSTTRSAMEHRLAVAARTREDLLAALAAAAEGQTPPGAARGRVVTGGAPKVVFVFPGQGSQWLGMGRQLLAEQPAFRAALESCDHAIQSEAGFSLLAELAADEAASQLGRIDVVQPVLFAIEVALAALWRSWGVEPDAVVGHSMGEVAAAHVAGALSLEDAVAIICRRSRLMRRISGQGEMAVVDLSFSEAEAVLAGYEDRLSIAVSNSPRSTVLSGDPAALGKVLSSLESKGVFCRRVKVDVASHSPQVDPLREDLLAILSALQPVDAEIAMRSTVTGEAVRGAELLAGYWADNLRQPVRFAAVVEALMSEGHGLFVEMSPHPILATSVEEIRRAVGQAGVTVGSLRRGQDEIPALLEALGTLWVEGYPVPWERLSSGSGRRVPLPTYSWQRERYWVEALAGYIGGVSHRGHAGGHPLLGEGQSLSTHASTRLWETTLDLQRLPWLSEHQVEGAVVFPGAGYLEMALSSGAEIIGNGPIEVTDVLMSQALAFRDDTPARVQAVVTEESPGRLQIQIASQVPGAGGAASWLTHARGAVRRIEQARTSPKMDLAALRERMSADAVSEPYAALAEMGLDYGPAFQGMMDLWRGDGEALGRVRLPDTAGPAAAYSIHPALLDACFHAALLGGLFTERSETTPWVPVAVGALRLYQRASGALWCHVHVPGGAQQAAERKSVDLSMYDGAGNLVVEISGLVVQRLAGSVRRREEDDWFLELTWESAAVSGPVIEGGRWVVLGEGGGLGAGLRAALEGAGHSVVHQTGINTSAAEVRSILTSAFGGLAPTAVVHIGSLDAGDRADAGAFEAALIHGCDSVLATVQALAAMGWRDAPRLWLVTRGAQAVGDHDVAVLQAPLLGLGRTVASEHPELRCGRIDLDPAYPPDEVAALIAEVVADDAEEEIALRGGERCVARLVNRVPEAERREKIVPAGDQPFRVELDGASALDRVTLRAFERRAPGPGEVEIVVEAAGLSYVDMTNATSTTPGASEVDAGGTQTLGLECAGRITAVGEGVSGLAVDQAVIALVEGGFATHVTTPAALVFPRPPALSAAEAATLPVAYLTAWYALDKVARLQSGERLLLLSAPRDVCVAAVQWARRVGAEVYAAAGSPEERGYLQSLGVRGVSDSHPDAFAADVRAWTGGEGVDVVLNYLSSQHIEMCLMLLSPGGRFVDLNRPGDHATNQIGVRLFKRGLSFSVVDLKGMMRDRTARLRALFEEFLGLIAQGAFSPPPIEAFRAGLAADAFRTMAQAACLANPVLMLADPEARIRVAVESGAAIRSDASYLVTGGLGGLGLRVAGWLAERGAGHVVLVGRSGAVSSDQRKAVALLRSVGARVTVAKADVAERAQIERILADIAASGMPLRGVVHAAGLLDDGLLLHQTPERLRGVMASKSAGALHLHTLTREMPLDFFVLYASIVGILGSPGQGNYAAANTFLDALAHHRRAQGLPALSIDWGTFSEVGMAVAQENRGARLVSRGMRSLTPDEGLTALGRLLEGGLTQSGVVSLNARQWVEFYPAAAASRMLSRLLTAQRGGTSKAGDQSLLDRIAAAEPGERVALVQEALRAQVSQVLRIPADRLDPDAPLTSLGMDSLMGLELRNRIEATLGVTVPAALLWTYPTVAALSEHLAGGARPDEPASAAPAQDHAEIDEMSSDDLTRLIFQKFEALS